MTQLQISLLLSAITTAGCALSATTPAGTLTPSELNSDPQKYQDQSVVVHGNVTLVPGGHNLYQSRELKAEFARRWNAEDPGFDPMDYVQYCLTIANPDDLDEISDELNGTSITVKGTFLANYLDGGIDRGACPLPTGIVIDVDDLARRYPKLFAPR